jgi:exopolyphosphatase/guanosine-5'-triphosphate,3'-diphosphate pyrophosphatase
LREAIVGVVDIGSNTVHLLVARTNGRTLSTIVDVSEGLSLGSDVDYGGTVSDDKLGELIGTLERFKAQATEAGAAELHLLATQAIRMAANRESVCGAVEEATGLRMDIISTEMEAELAFLGADSLYPSVGPQAMMDIGGGSVQVAIGVHGEVWDSVSLPLGAARLVRYFLPSDPPTYSEEAVLVSYLSEVVPPALPLAETTVTGLLGTGGTLRRTPPLLARAPGDELGHDALERVLEAVRGQAAEQIGQEYDIKPERARLIMPAALLAREVMRGYAFPPLIVSAYGLREGAILHFARRRAYRQYGE